MAGVDLKAGTRLAEESSPLSDPSEKVRHRWDPSITSNVDAVIEHVIRKYVAGEFSVVITPTMLCSMGTFEARFCSQAFRRKNRSAWVEERFPHGFASFVAEINLALQERGISVVNAKRELPLYSKLPRPSATTVKALAELVKSGEVSCECALSVLESDYGIRLTNSQRNYYFSATPSQDKSALELRKAALSKKIQSFKKELLVDLSLEACQQGVLYESFVGVLLAEIYGRDLIATQLEYPILHRDLSGRVKNRIFIDFQIELAEQIQIVEAKLGNSFENILDSALSQMVATERGTGERAMISVIYLKPCPVMKFEMDANIIIDDYLEAMELSDCVRPNLRIRDCIDYRSVSELLPPGENVFRECFNYLRENIAALSRDELRRLTRAFDRVRQADHVEDSLTHLLGQLAVMGVPSVEYLDTHFPQEAELSLAEQESFDRRIGVHLMRQQSALDCMLLELYNLATGSNAKQLGESGVMALESLSIQQFEELLLEYYSQKESHRISRRTSGEQHSKQSIIAACNRVLSIERADNLAIGKMIARETDEFVAAMSARFVQENQKHERAESNNSSGATIRQLKEFLASRSPLTGLLNPSDLGSSLLKDFNQAAMEREAEIEAFAERFLTAITGPQRFRALELFGSVQQARKIDEAERASVERHISTRIIRQACDADRCGQKRLPKTLQKYLRALDSSFSFDRARAICQFAEFARSRFDDIYHFNPGAIEIVSAPFFAARNPEQVHLVPSATMRAHIVISFFMFEMHNVLMGVELANSTGGTWVEAMSSKTPLEVPTRRLVGILKILNEFTEVKLVKLNSNADLKTERISDELKDSSAFNFSEADCVGLTMPKDILERLHDQIAASHFLTYQYLGWNMLDHFGEAVTTPDVKNRKLGTHFERLRTSHPERIKDVLMDDGCALRRLMCCDYYQHKLNQARILSYFDMDIATAFLFQNNPVIEHSEGLQEVYRRLGSAIDEGDSFFTELLS